MSYCSSCGSSVLPNSKFCAQCGVPTTQQADRNAPVDHVQSGFQAAQAPSSQNQKEALKYANQAILGNLFLIFCEVKGAAFSKEDFIPIIVMVLILMGVLYFCVIYQGIQKHKPKFVLIPTILLGALYLTLLVLELTTQNNGNNFFDWFSYVIGIGQVVLLGYVYMLIKPR